jgi:hypothetical protein
MSPISPFAEIIALAIVLPVLGHTSLNLLKISLKGLIGLKTGLAQFCSANRLRGHRLVCGLCMQCVLAGECCADNQVRVGPVLATGVELHSRAAGHHASSGHNPYCR